MLTPLACQGAGDTPDHRQGQPCATRRQAAPPQAAWKARPPAIPARQGIHVSEHFRVRRDKINGNGKLALRHNSRLHHIGIGGAWEQVLILIRDLQI
jgi:hypothetical protein